MRDRNPRLLCLALAGFIALTNCRKSDPGIDQAVTTLGKTEVTAQLIEIPDAFPPNDLYNYAYVLKYRILTVHRGSVQGNEILVGHYNPLKPRGSAQDENSGKIGGNLQRFQAGDIHRMALDTPLDEQWMGGIIDKYFEQKGPRYWAIWTNLVKK